MQEAGCANTSGLLHDIAASAVDGTLRPARSDSAPGTSLPSVHPFPPGILRPRGPADAGEPPLPCRRAGVTAPIFPGDHSIRLLPAGVTAQHVVHHFLPEAAVDAGRSGTVSRTPPYCGTVAP